MLDLGSHEHAFGSMNVKIDPKRVVNSIKEDVHTNEFKEVSIVNGKEAEGFTPMQWPLFDDGKPVSTNAMGYEVGGYYKRHQEALRMAQAEAELKEEDERVMAMRDGVTEKEEEPTVSVEELEAIRNAARKEGFTEGLNQGHAEGYEKGLEKGKIEGFNQGKIEGQEKGYLDGFKQGRDEGFAKGQEAGLAAGSEMVTTQADRFRHLADMLANPIREVDERVTDEIIYIISRLAKVVLKHEIKQDPEFIRYGIEKALTLIPDAKNNTEIVLSENDYALMVAAIGRDYMQSQNWNLKPSEEIEDGDILVNTEVSSVQWRVNERIDALLNDFLVAAAEVVSSARKESIDGAPEYDELPKKQIIPPRDILGMSDRIVQNMNNMAPQPNFAQDYPELHVEEEQYEGFDPDQTELQAAAYRHERESVLLANAQTPQAEASNSAVLGSQEIIEAAPISEEEQAMMQQAQAQLSAQQQALAQNAINGHVSEPVVAGKGAAAAVRAAQAQQ